MNKNQKSLSIIITTWNTAAITLKCVQTIKKYLKNIDYEIIISDNNSTDDTVARLKKEAGTTIIQNKSNLGFGGGGNVAAARATGDYLLFLNSDMELIDNSLNQLFNYFVAHPQIGLIGPKFLNPDLSEQGSVFPPQTLLNAFKESWLGQKAYGKYIPKSNLPLEVPIISGGAMLITRALFNQIGGWDHRYYMYFEDLELCRQVKKRGYKIYYYPKCRIIHRHGASGKSLADPQNQWRRLIPGSKTYHGLIKHYLLFLITRSGQIFRQLFVTK